MKRADEPHARNPSGVGPVEPEAPALGWNSAVLFGAQVGSALLGIATTLVVSRVLGPTALGEWRFALAVAAYLLVISDAGLSSLAIREIARDRSATARLGFPVLVVQAAVAGVLYVLLLAGLLLSDLSRTAVVVAALVGLGAFVHALGIGHVFQAFERMGTVARYALATQAVGTAAGLVALALTKDLVWLAVAAVAAGVTGNALLLRRARRAFDVPLAPPARGVALALLRAGGPFLVAAVATQLIFNADAILIEILRGTRALGIYSAGYAVAAQLLLLSGPVGAAVYPRLAAERDEGSLVIARATAGVLAFAILPLAAGGAAVCDQLVSLLYGSAFGGSARILAIAMALPALGAYNSVLNQTLNARGSQHTVMRVAVITALFNVAANLVLLPLVGIVGAAVAVAAAEVLTAVSFFVASRPVSAAALRGYLPNVAPAAAVAGAVLAARALWSTPLLVNVALGLAVGVAVAAAVPTSGARSVAFAIRSRGRAVRATS